MNRIVLFIIGFLLLSCTDEPPLKMTFTDSFGAPISLNSSIAENKGAVLLFLSPECPLCQNYSVVINEAKNTFSQKGISFIGIVSGDYYTTDEVNRYKAKYDIEFDILFDQDFKIAEFYHATTTPEAVLINQEGKLMYRGAIDNWAISLGKKRLEATDHYLKDALESFLSGNEIHPKITKPVGCFIE